MINLVSRINEPDYEYSGIAPFAEEEEEERRERERNKPWMCACDVIILSSITSDSTLNFPPAVGRKYTREFGIEVARFDSGKGGRVEKGNANNTTRYFREPRRNGFFSNFRFARDHRRGDKDD